MRIDEAVLRVQHAYTRIYLACHADHQNARTTSVRLSQRDSSILSHLSSSAPTRQSDLGKHLGIAKSTLSEALKWLEECGYVARAAGPGPGKEALVTLSEQGAKAMSASSVLDANQLGRLLESLDDHDRVRAVEGLELLATAALHTPKRRQRK